MASSLVGWELLYKLIAADLRGESDVIIAITHWFLITEGGFRCLGTGDNRTLAENEQGSELLPDNWNANSSSYSLRYIHNGKLYILLGNVANDALIVNILTSESLEVSNIAFIVKDMVKTLKGSLIELVPNIDTVVGDLRKNLLEPLKTKEETTSSAETQTHGDGTRPDASGINPRLPHGLGISPHYPERSIDDPLRNIGRGDLDPLGRGGGGMLFNPPGMPFRPGMPGMPGRPGQPFPGVIPGARFDPFGPIDPGRLSRGGPDPDHFPPPGYDDMFM